MGKLLHNIDYDYEAAKQWIDCNAKENKKIISLHLFNKLKIKGLM